MFSTRTIGRATAIAATLALVAGSAIPAGAAPDPKAETKAAQEAPKKQAKKDRLVCIQGEVTGSRLARQVCKTRDQWIDETGIDPLKR